MLRKRLLITYTVLIGLFLAVILMVVNRAVTGTINTQMENVTKEAVEVGAKNINNLFSDIISESLNLCIDGNLQESLERFFRSGSSWEDKQLSGTAAQAITGLRRKLTVEEVQIYPVFNGQYYREVRGAYREAGELKGALWVSRTVRAEGRFVLTENMDRDKTCLRLSKLILSDTSWPQGIALLEVNMDIQVISNLINQIQVEKGSVYLMDESGQILLPYAYYHQDGNDIFGGERSAAFISASRDMMIVRPLHTVGWRLGADVPMSAITAAGAALQFYVTAVSLVAIAAAVALALYFSSYISRPVLRLSGIMDQVREGDLDIRIPVEGQKGEMGTLYRNFNYMMDMINDLIKEVYIAKIREKQSELAALQAQINPHFLYNTLDSINWMAMRYGAGDIQKMVVSLAMMLRYSLNNGQNFIAVRDEIKQVQSYINLQQIRFGGCFESDIRIKEEMKDCIIIKLLLQPLVENAIIHGFDEGQYENGHLAVTGEILEEHLVFKVTNDGHRADLKAIHRILYPETDEKPKSYGIKNVNDRLIHQYGPEYMLHYQIEDDLTVVAFRIPMNR